ncbi:MAG: hypothetical protein QG657_3684 [Acidobacteriota bacterium]|nr:hypothetical protein [Acidobacteriota bacterium]
MKPGFHDPTGPLAQGDIHFSIHRGYYIVRVLISVLFVVLAVVFGIFGVTPVLLPFAGIFLVWGGTGLHVLLTSPVFSLGRDALTVSYARAGKNFRMSLVSLNCIISDLLTNPRARSGTIFISNNLRQVTIPKRLDVSSREILELLVERTTTLVEERRNFSAPPPQLKDITRKFQEQGLGEQVSIFKGPEIKYSWPRGVYRIVCILLYLMSLGFCASIDRAREFSVGAVVGISIFWGFMFVLGYIAPRIKKEEWLLVFPAGIAMIGKVMQGHLLWYEIKACKYRYLTGRHRASSGLYLVISTRASISISIPDIYSVPLPCIEQIILRQARQSGVFIK